MDAQVIERYVFACQCPYCRDGIAYRMLPLHIYQMHGISAYDFRKMYGWNRKHKLSSRETLERMSERSKRNKSGEQLKKHPHWANIENRYKDGGQRAEAIKSKRIRANKPEVKERFIETMSKIDRKEIAAKIPPEVRRARGIKARMMWKVKVPAERQKEIMALARSLRTPESERKRVAHAQKTMREKYWDNPKWVSKWLQHLTEAFQAKAKVPRSDYTKIVKLYENGMSQGQIASQYNVSRSLIYLIIKSQRLGLSKLYQGQLVPLKVCLEREREE